MARMQHLLQLKQEFPNSTVKLRESYEKVGKRHCVPISVRRPRFRSRNESLPYTEVAAHRGVRTTIGQELKALYQVPHDLPQGMLTLLIQLNARRVPGRVPKARGVS